MSYAADNQASGGCIGRGAWGRREGRGAPLFQNGVEIGAMVLGFVFYWPVGLALLFYFAWRKRDGGAFRGFSMPAFGRGSSGSNGFDVFRQGSGNAAFDEYRVAVMKRLEEERRKLDEEQMAFRAFVERLRRAKDQDEFDRFMRDRNASPEQPAG